MFSSLYRVCSTMSLWKRARQASSTGTSSPVWEVYCKFMVSILASHTQTEGGFTTGDGHFLQSQTASCHNYGWEWKEMEKERNGRMDRRPLTSLESFHKSFAQCLWVFEASGLNVVGHLLMSIFDVDPFWIIFFLGFGWRLESGT